MYLNKKQKKAISDIIEAIDLGYMRYISKDVELACDVLCDMLEKNNRTHKNEKRKPKMMCELEELENEIVQRKCKKDSRKED